MSSKKNKYYDKEFKPKNLSKYTPTPKPVYSIKSTSVDNKDKYYIRIKKLIDHFGTHYGYLD